MFSFSGNTFYHHHKCFGHHHFETAKIVMILIAIICQPKEVYLLLNNEICNE
jgi:hypothetical protein